MMNESRPIIMDVIRDCSPTRPKLTKTSDRHPKSVLEQINQLRRGNDFLCDVILNVGTSRIKAHKIILCASSPYFRAMFTNGLAESKQNEITLRDIDENAMEILIDFCYTSKITVDEKTVQTVLPAACLLQLQEVQDYCAEFLKSQLDPSNCLGIRAFADTHSCRELLKIADKYLQNNFCDVIESDEFLLLPINDLIEIISNDELNVNNEETVYQAVINWVKQNENERKQYIGQLMYHVRLPLLDTKFLVTKVGTNPLIRHDQVCRDLLDEAKDFHLLKDKSSILDSRIRPRKPVIIGEVLFAVGGWCSGDAISSVEMFDPQCSNEWKIVSPLTKRRCGVGVGVLNNQIYAIGGHDGSTYLNSTERYDPLQNQWFADVAPTNTCRTSVGVGVLNGYLYAVGGQDGISCLNLVDKYDPGTNRWTRVASMTTRRLGVAVVVLNNYLFAIGGSDGTSPLNTVEKYDPKSNKWTPVASMLTRRKHLGCAVYKNFIYAVGGRDDTAELNSAEKYNPQTNQWQPIVSMKSRRSGVGLAVLNGCLMAIGGFDGSSYLKTCEVYDEEVNCWKVSCSMIYRRLGGGVGVVKMQKEKDKNAVLNAQKSVVGQNSSWPLFLSPVPSLLDNVPQNQLSVQHTQDSFSTISINSPENRLISGFSNSTENHSNIGILNSVANESSTSSLLVNRESSSQSSENPDASSNSTSNHSNMMNQKTTVKLVDL